MGSLELTDDFEFILRVMNDPEMAERINEGDERRVFTIEDVESMADVGYTLGWYVDDEIKGFYWVHALTTSILQMHSHFPAENRKFARGSGKPLLDWLNENADPSYQKFISMIPACYPDVIGFCKREGLTEECLIPKASNKGGTMVDLFILSVSRGDI